MKNIFVLLVFVAVMCSACKSEKDDLAVEPAFVSVLDKNYYYLPEYETYYFPPTHEWYFYADEIDGWVTSQVIPIRLWKTNLNTIYKIKLDYIGSTPYEFHAIYKAKYPPKHRQENSSSKGENVLKKNKTQKRHSSIYPLQSKKRYNF